MLSVRVFTIAIIVVDYFLASLFTKTFPVVLPRKPFKCSKQLPFLFGPQQLKLLIFFKFNYLNLKCNKLNY